MRKWLLILFLLQYKINITAQVGSTAYNNIDRLKVQLAKQTEDKRKVYLYSEISNSYVRIMPDSAYYYALRGMKLAQKINDIKDEDYCRISMAQTAWGIGDYPFAIKLILPHLKEIEGSKDSNLIVSAYMVLFNTYRDQGDFKEALRYDLHIIGIMIKNKGEPPRISLAALAGLYLKTDKMDSAAFFLRWAFQRPPDPGVEGWPNFIAGEFFRLNGNNDSALHYYRHSIELLSTENNLKDISGTYNSMAELFRKNKQLDSSIYYAQQSIKISLPKNYLKEDMEANLQLSATFEELNNIDGAFHYFKQAIAAKDSLYNQEKQRQILGYQFNEQLKQQDIENAQVQYKNKIRTNILFAATAILILIGILLWRNNRHKQKAKAKIEKAYSKLKSTQAQLIQSEKMASLGELTAGIAHEIQNPLNFVNNFSDVNKEMLEELKAERSKPNAERDESLQDDLINDVIANEEKINHHGKRADAIVKGMLQHSRVSSGQKEPTDINALAGEYLRLSYHGLRAKDKNFNATIETNFDPSIEKINVIPQDIGRVFLNLFNNAFYACAERSRSAVNEQKSRNLISYQPTVFVSTQKCDGKVQITVRDNGNGIPQKIIDKIFQPFFTTKPTGEGTGLGLSLSYDIIKAHGGEIKVESKEGEGSEFIIQLPI